MMSKLVSLKNKFQQIAFEVFNSDAAKTIEKVRAENLSYLETAALRELAEVALDNEKKGIEGIIIEAGCALGGSGIVLATAKDKSRELLAYDVFGMIPPPSERDDDWVDPLTSKWALTRSQEFVCRLLGFGAQLILEAID